MGRLGVDRDGKGLMREVRVGVVRFGGGVGVGDDGLLPRTSVSQYVNGLSTQSRPNSLQHE